MVEDSVITNKFTTLTRILDLQIKKKNTINFLGIKNMFKFSQKIKLNILFSAK